MGKEKPKIIPNETGTLITMKCKCQAKPAPVVTWFKDQTQVKESSRIKMKCTPLDNDFYELVLELKDPSGSDGGPYRCHVKNVYGESNAKLNLNIEAEPEPEGGAPTFIEKPKMESSADGKKVTMSCKVKADPKPSVVWTREGVTVKESSRISISIVQEKDSYAIKLELKDPQPADAGLYKCTVKNVHGEVNANLTLNIEIVPVIREPPKVIRIEKKRTVVVECHVESQFEPTVMWYKEQTIVQKNSTHKISVHKVSEGGFAVKLEINEVSQSDRGTYKLMAKNQKGQVVSQTVAVGDIPDDEEEEEQQKPEEKKEKKEKLEEKKKVGEVKKVEEKKKVEEVKKEKIEEIKKIEEVKKVEKVEEKVNKVKSKEEDVKEVKEQQKPEEKKEK